MLIDHFLKEDVEFYHVDVGEIEMPYSLEVTWTPYVRCVGLCLRKPRTAITPNHFLASYSRNQLFACFFFKDERKSEQAHITQAPTLLENAVYNEWQFQASVTGNRTKKGIYIAPQKD